MPLIDIQSFADEHVISAAGGLLDVFSVMICPDNEADRETWLRGMEGKFAAELLLSKDCRSDGEKIELLSAANLIDERNFALKVTSKSTRVFDGSGHEKVFPGLIAGKLLAMLFLVSLKYCRDDIGRSRAYNAMSRADPKNIKLGRRNLQKVWERFSPVAHLWAAYLLNGQSLGETIWEVSAFLSFATVIQRWGESFETKRSQEPLLSGDRMWIVPKELLYSFQFIFEHDLPPQWKVALNIKSLKPRKDVAGRMLSDAQPLRPGWAPGFAVKPIIS